MPPTYKDIQRRTGLSLATISKYFNGGTVREDNRVAIEEAAAVLGFRVNELARSLRTRRSRTVGVLLPALNNDFHLSIIDGVEGVLKDAGVGVLLCSTHQQEGSSVDAVGLLVDRRVDGIIAVPSAGDTAGLETAAARGMSVVLIDRLVPNLTCDAVVLDNQGASRRVLTELVDRGHRDIAIITGPDDVWTMAERLAGFRHAMGAAGLPVSTDFVRTGPLTVESGSAAMRGLLAGAHRPTAVYATNYELTLGALIVLNESGVRVPEELSFVGFDGRDIASITSPRTAVFVQPVREFGRLAADMMLRRLVRDGADTAELRVLPGRFVPGGSVGPALR